MSNWQPIESAPKDGTNILICGHACGGYYVADVKWNVNEGTWCLFDPAEDGHTYPSEGHTHWMPLPEPPNA